MTPFSSSWRLGIGALLPVSVGKQLCLQCTGGLGFLSLWACPQVVIGFREAGVAGLPGVCRHRIFGQCDDLASLKEISLDKVKFV